MGKCNHKGKLYYDINLDGIFCFFCGETVLADTMLLYSPDFNMKEFQKKYGLKKNINNNLKKK